MCGRWPSSAAFSVSWKPGAVRVRSKGEKYWIERFQVPAGSFSVCEVCSPVPRTLPSLQSLFGPITAPGKSEARPRFFEQDADLRRGAAGFGAGLGALEQHVAFGGVCPSVARARRRGWSATRLKFGGAWLFQAARLVIT